MLKNFKCWRYKEILSNTDWMLYINSSHFYVEEPKLPSHTPQGVQNAGAAPQTLHVPSCTAMPWRTPSPSLHPGALGGRPGIQLGEHRSGASQLPLSIQEPAAHSRLCKCAPKAAFKQWKIDTARSKHGRGVFIQIQTCKIKNFIQNHGVFCHEAAG